MSQFDYFVVFADRRTGSNFLEANVNAIAGLTCHGEAFNPNFIGFPDRSDILGITREERDANPKVVLDRLKVGNGLHGFRYFNSHDARVFDGILADPKCAKIILTRNPVESFVSLEIARATNQWKLTNVSRLREKSIEFDQERFEKHLADQQEFQLGLLNGLQTTGQTAFYLSYEDLQSIEVMNGLAAFLGCDGRLSALDKSFKKQNPSPMSDKVKNFDQMRDGLARLDWFNLNRTPNFEPRRGPSVPTFIAAATSPLLYMPIRSGPEDAVTSWLAALDNLETDALISDFTQDSLQDWKRQRAGHRSFTVVRHPVARAHAAFSSKILQTGRGTYASIRDTISKQFNFNLPATYPDAAYQAADHKAAFLGYLRFVKSNLAGQTAIRVDSHWATQATVLQGFAEFATPDLVLREDRLQDDLAILAAQIGKETMPQMNSTDPYRDQLADIYDSELEAAVHDVYRRDYDAFGFGLYA